MKQLRFLFLSTSFVFIILFGNNILNAQDFKIVTKSAKIVNDEVLVTYEFETFKKNQKFKVWIEIKKSTGEKIKVKSLTGDVGKDIEGGKDKQIIWDVLNDKILIDDEIGIEVFATLINNDEQIIIENDIVDNENEKTITSGKALLLSAVLPGLGIAKLKQKNSFFALSVITYGTAAMSYIYNNMAYNNYTEYLDNEIISSESDSFNKSKTQKTMSNVFLYTAAATWTTNLIWTVIASSKNNKSTAFYNNNRLNFTVNINRHYKIPEFGISYKF